MWWEWASNISVLDAILFSLLSILISYFVGYGVLKVLSYKKQEIMTSFDFIQRANLRIFVGFIFIFLFILIFSIFNLSFFYSSSLVIIIAAACFVITRKSISIKRSSISNRLFSRDFAFLVAFFILLLVTVLLSSGLIAGLYGGTNDDGADHTLMTRIILDYPNSLVTRSAQPYASFTLQYPSATHVLSAFFVTVLGVPIQKIVIMFSVILPALIALSFYSTIKHLFRNRFAALLGSIIAAFFTVGPSLWPISWGGLPVLLSIYVSVCSLGLFCVLLLKEKVTWLSAFLVGLTIFMASQTYPGALLMVSLWLLLILFVKLGVNIRVVRGRTSSSIFNKTNLAITGAFIIPILFSVPYLYFIFSQNIIGAHATTLNPVSDLSAEIMKTRVNFNWLIDIPALSDFFSGFGKLFSLAPISLVTIALLLIPKVSRRMSSTPLRREFALSLLLIYSFMLIIMTYLTLTLNLSINLLSNFLNPERVWQYIFIPAVIMTACVLFSAIYLVFSGLRWLFNHNRAYLPKVNKNKILACLLLVFFIVSICNLSVPAIKEQQASYAKLGSSFYSYALNQDDILMMQWIAKNTLTDCRILVSAGDSGQFVTAVTQRQTVSMYSYLGNYVPLMTLLTSNASDPQAVSLLIKYTVSYVYIGSTATTYALQNAWYRHFNATQFLSTPYFTLSNRVGNAWLFNFNATVAQDSI